MTTYGVKFVEPKLNSLGKPPQDERWCLKFAVEDAKKEGKEPGSKAFADFVKKRAEELYKVHGPGGKFQTVD